MAQTDFGVNLPEVFAGMESVVERGLLLLACFDHTQFLTPTEHPKMLEFIAACPTPWQRQECVVGTSSKGAGFISHAKRRVFNAPINGYSVPERPYGYYQTLDHVLEDGYPLVELGSANMTSKAMRQVNDVLFIPSSSMAVFYVDQIQREHDWVVAHEQAYQPFPKKSATGGS